MVDGVVKFDAGPWAAHLCVGQKSKDHDMCITVEGSVNPDIKRKNYLEMRYVVEGLLLLLWILR